ncbi:MAG: hypothetical protein HYU66_01655 [Armatimonadetes bacterium]|nr:hypothetical protein [Armatimonadota bacterium]
MSEQLWLQEGRRAVDELGFGLAYDFGRANAAEVKRLIRTGGLHLTSPSEPGATDPTIWYDEIGGHFMGRPESVPDLTLADCDLDEPDEWQPVKPFYDGQSRRPALTHTHESPFTIQGSEDLRWGQGVALRFLTYQGTGASVAFWFGGVWSLRLGGDGRAALSRRTVDEDGAEVWDAVAEFDWMTADRWEGAEHVVFVYEVRGKLVVRSGSLGAAGRALGTVYDDPGSLARPDDSYTADEPQELDERSEPIRHALQAGRWKVSGAGRLALACGPVKWRPGIGYLWREPALVCPGGSTRPVTVDIAGVGSDPSVTPFVSVTDESGAEWPQSGGSGSDARAALGWSVSFTSTAEQTWFLSHLAFTVPTTWRSDGAVGTDVLALTAVAAKRLELSREGDLTRERFSAAVLCDHADLAAYVQPNLSVRYAVDGVTLFRGLTDGGSWDVVADTVPPIGLLTLRAEGLWKRFRKATWPGGAAFDGRLLTDCLADVARAAGLTDDEVDIEPWDYTFPTPPSGEPPALVYRPGTSLDRILEDLHDKFYGPCHLHYFRLSDGAFVFRAYDPAAAVAATFYETVSAAAAAGVPQQVILAGSYQEVLDESEMANVVVVLGQRPDGRPLLARAVDWGSLRDPTARNYVAEAWPLIVADPGLQTQEAVNYVCRRLFDRHRRPRIQAQWRSVRVDAFPGERVQLAGANYGTTYILRGISLERTADGDAADPLGRASYAAELVA